VPSIPVLTNIDNDHLDNYGTIDAIEAALGRFLASTDSSDPKAVLVGCGDDVRVRRVLLRARSQTRLPSITYGFKGYCDVRALNLRADGLGWKFDVLGPFGLWADVQLPMPGEHNILNALAAISVAWHLGVSEDCVRAALSGIERVARRFEIKGVVRGVRVVDDYGHHPTEIRATLAAARQSTSGRVGMIFQPHRYTRTAALMQDFAACFEAADALFLMPIYAASEAPIPGVDHASLARAITIHGKPVQVCIANDRADAVRMAAEWAKNGDTILTQGAGDVTRAGDELVSRL
ncbi:MAG TPA: cyanophycin synthetase, partial [Planctomycetota bacterium]|nr:cyanophycin synthetase [Planctomycetota bacterium]